jgi:hypothetical protein
MVETLTLPNFCCCVLRVALRCCKHGDLVGPRDRVQRKPAQQQLQYEGARF